MSVHQLSENTYLIPDSTIIMDKFMNTKTNRRIIRKCSFCNCEGHNVSTCNDHALTNFHNYLIYYKNNNTSNSSSNYILNVLLTIENVERFLYEFCSISIENRKLLKAYACRYCNSRIRSLLTTSINKIIVQLFDMNYNYLFNNDEFILFDQETTLRISDYINNVLLNYVIYYDLDNENNSNQNNFHYNQDNQDNHKFNIILNDDSYEETTDENECAICYNPYHLKNGTSFICNHNFCVDCTIQLVKTKHKNCPSCRSTIEKITCYNNKTFDKLKF
jgi:hypothetical protein|uniref:RING-type domain-containing protein n=1 Tax=viral metagenome TaxID=1070528 RepID=A0A6C0DJM1_9ZZZZ